MPRIRSLKPEHRSHRKVGRLTDREYRLWVGLLVEADDDGRLVADVDQIRLLVFGYQSKTTRAHVAQAMEALAASGLIVLYENTGTTYAAFPDWRDHQRIDRPKKSNLPSIKDSTIVRRMIVERSSIDRRGSRSDLIDLDRSRSRSDQEEQLQVTPRTISHEIGSDGSTTPAARPATPARGTYAKLEKQMRAQHPGVTDAELGALVMERYQALLKEAPAP